MFDAISIKKQITKWIRDYFDANFSAKMAVVGISGGKDSSVVAALCVEALGCDKVLGVLMPRGEQADIDIAISLVKTLKIDYHIINIGEPAEKLLGDITNIWQENNRAALINTPARLRMATLYAVSACVGGRVANTCNLSEDYVGYATKFGDGAGDFSPLSELTVQEVKAVGKALGLPDKFIEKTPIDGLSGKSDEENLGFTYEVLDRYIRLGLCEDAEIKSKIDRLHEANLHKLQAMPKFIPNEHRPFIDVKIGIGKNK